MFICGQLDDKSSNGGTVYCIVCFECDFVSSWCMEIWWWIVIERVIVWWWVLWYRPYNNKQILNNANIESRQQWELLPMVHVVVGLHVYVFINVQIIMNTPDIYMYTAGRVWEQIHNIKLLLDNWYQ